MVPRRPSPTAEDLELYRVGGAVDEPGLYTLDEPVPVRTGIEVLGEMGTTTSGRGVRAEVRECDERGDTTGGPADEREECVLATGGMTGGAAEEREECVLMDPGTATTTGGSAGVTTSSSIGAATGAG